MKRHPFIKISATLAVAMCTWAQAADFEDYARVISVTPQFEQVNMPRQECRTEYETRETHRRNPPQNERSTGGAILGGIAGGILGNQIGGGNGKTAATAAGAIVGALVGDRVENNNNNSNNDYNNSQPSYESRPVRQCRQIDNWESRTVGYSVTYEYHGRNYTSIMPYDPGSRLKLHVSLTPRP